MLYITFKEKTQLVTTNFKLYNNILGAGFNYWHPGSIENIDIYAMFVNQQERMLIICYLRNTTDYTVQLLVDNYVLLYA